MVDFIFYFKTHNTTVRTTTLFLTEYTHTKSPTHAHRHTQTPTQNMASKNFNLIITSKEQDIKSSKYGVTICYRNLGMFSHMRIMGSCMM